MREYIQIYEFFSILRFFKIDFFNNREVILKIDDFFPNPHFFIETPQTFFKFIKLFQNFEHFRICGLFPINGFILKFLVFLQNFRNPCFTKVKRWMVANSRANEAKEAASCSPSLLLGQAQVRQVSTIRETHVVFSLVYRQANPHPPVKKKRSQAKPHHHLLPPPPPSRSPFLLSQTLSQIDHVGSHSLNLFKKIEHIRICGLFSIHDFI